MNRAWTLVALAAVALAAGAYITTSRGEAGGSSSEEGTKARALLHDASGAQVGTVKLEQDGDVVKLKIQLDGSITPGFHGFHVHTTGACVAPFTSAGGHYNPGAATHRSHAGDLPVLLIDGDGEAEARVGTDRFALGDLLAGDGSAFILHANADNYANIPTDRYEPDPDTTTLNTGDAGGRIACGVIAAS
jgi:Cu-Zn family superoxide dismutase